MVDLPSSPLWLQGGAYAADDDRALIRSLVVGEGVVRAGDLAVTANGTPNMSVNVAPGRAYVQRTGATDFYLVEVDTTTNLTVSAADPTNPRKDIVVVRVYDSAYSGSANKATLEVIAGTPAASPSEPAVPNNAIKLAVITVSAGASSVTASAIAAPTNGIPIVTWASNAASGAPVQTAYRNKIRNGDMSVAQRGSGSFTASAVYTVDGWRKQHSGGSHTVDRVSATVGVDLGAEGAAFALQSVVAGQSAAGDYAFLEHRIEGVRLLAGKQVTLSFTAKAASGTPKIGVEVQQFFGTGGSPSGTVNTAVQAVTLSTTATRYSVTFTVPSIVGKTLGTNDNDYLAVVLWLSAGSTLAPRASSIGIQNATISITDVQLEAGAVATPFERLPVQQQLAWCQRYFYRTGVKSGDGAGTHIGLGFATTTTRCHFQWKHPVFMRSAPTLGLPAANTLQAIDFASFNAGTAVVADAVDRETARIYLDSTGLTQFRPYMLYCVSASGYIDVSAEL